MKYRKKPVVIEAVQWFKMGDNPNVETLGTDDIKPQGSCQYCKLPLNQHGWIATLEGGHIVCPADWIITGVENEHYPCKPSVFAATYEPVPVLTAEAVRESRDTERDAARYRAIRLKAVGFSQGLRRMWSHLSIYAHGVDLSETLIPGSGMSNPEACDLFADAAINALGTECAAKEPRPKIICLSGSTRFIERMAIEAWELEKGGNIVLGCHLLPDSYTTNAHHEAEAQGVAAQMDELHLRKIDLCDELLVLNVGGYIGDSTRREIAYAEAHGKPIAYLNECAAMTTESTPTSTEDHA